MVLHYNLHNVLINQMIKSLIYLLFPQDFPGYILYILTNTLQSELSQILQLCYCLYCEIKHFCLDYMLANEKIENDQKMMLKLYNDTRWRWGAGPAHS